MFHRLEISILQCRFKYWSTVSYGPGQLWDKQRNHGVAYRLFQVRGPPGGAHPSRLVAERGPWAVEVTTTGCDVRSLTTWSDCSLTKQQPANLSPSHSIKHSSNTSVTLAIAGCLWWYKTHYGRAGRVLMVARVNRGELQGAAAKWTDWLRGCREQRGLGHECDGCSVRLHSQHRLVFNIYFYSLNKRR